MKFKDKEIEDSKTLVMGILNVTPDSFSGDGITDHKFAIDHALELIKNGADIIDIGGESSKPGSERISTKEELIRVYPIIENLLKNTDAILSIDTHKVEVACVALNLGVHIINDITGLQNPRMAELVAKYGASVVIMHMQGDPESMQQNPHYENVIEDICEFFKDRIKVAKDAGVDEDKIILDPGIGFGKTLEHNLEILRNLKIFKDRFNYPVLIGTSRKSFIGKITGKEVPSERVFGTAATVALSIANDADIVRVHDVKEMVDVVKVADAIVRN